MGPDLWELYEFGEADDEIAAIIRLGHYAALPPGVRVVTQFNEIVTVRMRRGDIPKVSGAPEVASMIAGDSYLGPDLELESTGLPELSTTMLDTDERRPKNLDATGLGVIVGVVDWGFDFAHPDFRKSDGSTRIIALWDQRGGKRPDSPKPFGYGVVHDRDAINRALKEKDPYAALHYHPADADTGIGCHGTHVASIAAGSGGDGRPSGIAPGAELVLVHNSPWDEEISGKLGDSVTVLEGIDFIAQAAANRPWVINLSMGRHAEAHNGRTMLEQGFDAAIQAAAGRAICMSVGNYFDKAIHASGQLRPTQERTFVWKINEGSAPTDYNELEIWYSPQDKFEVTVRSPDGTLSAQVKIGERAKLLVSGKEVGNVYHRAQEPNNLDNHVHIFLYKEAPAGAWEVTVHGADVINGRFHAWIEREVSCPKCQSHFRKEDADPRSTTGTICNGLRTIAVGAYSEHDVERRLGHFSSLGPTTDGRLKPDLCAPGVAVLAARSAARDPSTPVPLLTRMSGTSMAAPHVTGTVALMFSAAPRRLRIEETHNLLLASAERVSVPEEYPDRIGIGYLDVEAAVEAARKVTAPSQTFREFTVGTRTAAPTSAKSSAGEGETGGLDSVEQSEGALLEGRAEFDVDSAESSPDNTFHRVANDITSAFEGGSPGTLNLYDLGIISYGKHQATLASGTLFALLKRYVDASNGATASALSGYLDRVKRRDETLRDDAEFVRLLKDAAKEPEMARAQDDEFTKDYWQPAKERAARVNVTSALGYALFYDTRVQGGLDDVLKSTQNRLGGKVGDIVGGNAVAEIDFLKVFIDERIKRHLRIAAYQRKTAAGLNTEAQALETLAATDTVHADELQRQAAEKRRKAKQNVANANALETSANKTRGPSLKALVESGDLNLLGDAHGEIHLTGKPGAVIAGLQAGAAIESIADAQTDAVQGGEAELAPSDAEAVHTKRTSAPADGNAVEALALLSGVVDGGATSEFERNAGAGESIHVKRPAADSDAETSPDTEASADALAFESLAEQLLPADQSCSEVTIDCLAPPAADLKLVRPKGKAEGDFIDRTEGDRSINYGLQLIDYDVNAYLPSKTRHTEALAKIREFIVDRSVRSSENIAVTITGLASRTGGQAYNDVLSCKRARCAAENLRSSLDFFRGVPQRVQITISGEGFTRATCNGSDCELGEWRSVLVQVHSPSNPPVPIPPVDPGWNKYTIRCCSYQTTTLASAVLSDLLAKGLPQLPEALRGKLVDQIRKGIAALIKQLAGKLATVGELERGLSELLALFPGEVFQATGTFEITEREKANPRSVVLCYSGWGLRIIFPRTNIDGFLDDTIGKVEQWKRLPILVRRQLRDGIKKLIPDLLKTLVQPVESSTPGPAARFDLTHPHNLRVFEGGAQIGAAILEPGRVAVGFDSAPWNRPDPVRRPHIVNCLDTSCADSVISTQVGSGKGLELFSVSHGDLVAGPCTCASPISSPPAAQAESATVERSPADLVDVAEQIIAETASEQDQRPVLHEALLRTGLEVAVTVPGTMRLARAAEIFDAFAYQGSPALRAHLEQYFEIVALPQARLESELHEADVLVRRSDGGTAHISLIASPQLMDLEGLLSDGLRPERFGGGNYVHVVENGPRPHQRGDGFARQITQQGGFVPRDTLVLRLKPAPPAQAVKSAAPSPPSQTEGDAERVNALDLVLTAALLTRPQTVVVTAPQAVTAAADPAKLKSDDQDQTEAAQSIGKPSMVLAP